jgi:hypothetical protein
MNVLCEYGRCNAEQTVIQKGKQFSQPSIHYLLPRIEVRNYLSLTSYDKRASRAKAFYSRNRAEHHAAYALGIYMGVSCMHAIIKERRQEII